MKYCKRCLQPDTRPNTKFLPSGICPACDYFDRLKDVDWRERYEILHNLIAGMTRAHGSGHDCIIGVSGGKDSTRQALWIRDKLKMHPLLVCLTYPPEQLTDRGANNISNLIELGFDVVVSAPAPGTWKRLMRVAFDRFANFGKSTELALFSSVPQIAIKYGIQLIFWGENPGLQVGDLKTLGRSGYDGNNLRHMNTLSGGTMDWMLEAGFDSSNLIPYQYPTLAEFDRHRLQIVYLGWFLGDWSLVNNGMYSSANGLEIRHDTVENTGDLHGVTSLDEDWVIVNQLIKYYKYGFGRVTDYVNEQIRFERMTRAEGVRLVEQYDGACSPDYVSSFSEYIGIGVTEFWDRVRASLNRELFDLGPGNRITRRYKVGEGL